MIYANLNKKELERRFLDGALRLLPSFPRGDIEPGETPDFIITKKNKKIGIEVTRVYIDDSQISDCLQSIESTRARIIKKAEDIYEQSGSPSVYVDLFFNSPIHIRKEREVAVAAAIARVVIQNLPLEGESVEVEYVPGNLQPIEVDLIRIHRIDDFGNERWNVCDGGSPIHDAIFRIQQTINHKAQKLGACLAKCDEVGLLIVAPSWTPAGMIHPGKESLEHIYQSEFSHTYFYNDSFDQIFELNTTELKIQERDRFDA